MAVIRLENCFEKVAKSQINSTEKWNNVKGQYETDADRERLISTIMQIRPVLIMGLRYFKISQYEFVSVPEFGNNFETFVKHPIAVFG